MPENAPEQPAPDARDEIERLRVRSVAAYKRYQDIQKRIKQLESHLEQYPDGTMRIKRQK